MWTNNDKLNLTKRIITFYFNLVIRKYCIPTRQYNQISLKQAFTLSVIHWKLLSLRYKQELLFYYDLIHFPILKTIFT